MLAAATSLFARTNISQSYIIGPASPAAASSSTSTAASTSTLPAAAPSPPFNVGPWRVQHATHKTTAKRVAVWSVDKRSAELERCAPAARERVLEVLKAEASALGRLRHPSILEMVEPLEETRSELTFATEPLLSSLAQSIPDASPSPLVDLDEVEIQKGILQICKGLSFLHTSARLIHSNLSPFNILINTNGDWKVSGLGLTIPLAASDGSPTRWEFPTYDARLPPHVQRSFDYMAPEYALDEQLTTASDMYALGCLIYAVHCRGSPPFKHHGSLSAMRENPSRSPGGMERLDPDLRSLLLALITRHAQPRPTPTSLPTFAFFSSLPVSTLNFLDRSTFASKSREEKIAFMKGLGGVLPRFSDGLRTRKILPSLVEEMKDAFLLPSILPNVFVISKTLPRAQFASIVLPSLKPLFSVKDPPQNMLTLLDNLVLLQEKTDKTSFKEHVLPLVYNALESEHAVVQERALKAVPDLCESIDYAEVQSVLFPRVALVFTKTRILSVKVSTLTCFLAMVKTLDQTSLTQKLVPLLSKIRTREPAVMLGTLAVQEAMGMKVDREAVATLVLPQLWAMSMGPMINVEQFQRFMSVIRALGTRVEKEHLQYLKDSQRIEDRSVGTSAVAAFTANGGSVDFESLVGGGSGGGSSATGSTKGTATNGWNEDDVWGSILADTPMQTPASTPPPALSSSRHVPSLSLRTASKSISPIPAPPRHSLSSQVTGGSQPDYNRTTASSALYNTNSSLFQPQGLGIVPLVPQTQTQTQPAVSQRQQPNYNISLTPAQPNYNNNLSQPQQQPAPNYHVSLSSTSAQSPGFAVLAPSTPAKPAWGGSLATGDQKKQAGKDAWGDFDPLG